MAGLMSVINTLASSPVGKVAGGYMEGKLDKAKEERRLQEKKDDRYAAITDSVVTGLIGIDANLISNAVREDELYKQAVKWATGKFGSYGKGLYWAEQMLHDGAFEGAKSFQEVLNFTANLYGGNLPEGSEPWWKQPEYIEHATKYEDLYKVPSTHYQDKISKSKTNISNILSENGIGDYTFQLFTGAEPGKTIDKQPGKLTETPTDQEVSQVSTVDTGGEIVERPTLPTTFPSITNRGIQGFKDSTFTKEIGSQVALQYPTITQMYIEDTRTGTYHINTEAFAANPNKLKQVHLLDSFVKRSLTEMHNAYQSGKMRDTIYSKFEQFYNTKDFNEIGFVQTLVDDYYSVLNAEKAEIIKTNILRADLSEAIEKGIFPTYLLADLSNRLDEAFDPDKNIKSGSTLSWENLYLDTLGYDDHRFKKLYNEVVNKYLSEKLSKEFLGDYKHSMKYIDSEQKVEDVYTTDRPTWALEGETFLSFYRRSLTDWVEHEIAESVDIDIQLNELAPENYADLLEKRKNLEISEDIPIESRIVEDPPSEDIVQFNVSNIAKFKLDRVDTKPIEGLSEVASIILANPSIQTSADVYTLIDQNNQDAYKVKQQIMGFIINDMIDGNLPQMNGLQINDVAEQVLKDIETFIEDSYEGGSEKTLEENITDTVTSENQEVIEEIVKENESSSNILSATLQEGSELTGEGDEPWLFADGSFNPDWKGKLEGSNLIEGTQANRYYIDKKVYERKEQARKDLEIKKKQEKTKKKVKNVFGETFKWLQEKKEQLEKLKELENKKN